MHISGLNILIPHSIIPSVEFQISNTVKNAEKNLNKLVIALVELTSHEHCRRRTYYLCWLHTGMRTFLATSATGGIGSVPALQACLLHVYLSQFHGVHSKYP